MSSGEMVYFVLFIAGFLLFVVAVGGLQWRLSQAPDESIRKRDDAAAAKSVGRAR
jgi:hypothetical protein